jgi:hypothetical protein
MKKIHNLPGAANNIVPFDLNYIKRWLDDYQLLIKIHPIEHLFEIESTSDDEWYDLT